MNLLDYDSLFIMNQKIKNIEARPNAVEEPLNETPKDRNELQNEYYEKKEQLVKDFGTNKSKKIINSRKSNIVKEENISSTNAMHNMLEKSAKHLEQNQQHSKDDIINHKINFVKGILPEFDLEAKEAKDIYTLGSGKLVFLF